MANPAVASREVLKQTYLTWVNDFLTVSAFADWLEVDEPTAHLIIGLGRLYHTSDVQTERLVRAAPADWALIVAGKPE